MINEKKIMAFHTNMLPLSIDSLKTVLRTISLMKSTLTKKKIVIEKSIKLIVNIFLIIFEMVGNMLG